MGSQTETILRQKIARHARARLFSAHAQTRLSQAISAECAILSQFFNIQLKAENPEPAVEAFDISLPALSVFPVHFSVEMPTTESEPPCDILVSLDLSLVNTVAAYRISGTLDPSTNIPADAIGAVEKRLAAKFASVVTAAIHDAIMSEQAEGTQGTDIDGKSNPSPTPCIATVVDDLETAPFGSSAALFIRLSFSPTTVDDQSLGTFCMTFPADLISGADTGKTITRQSCLSFDPLADAISLDVRSILSELILPLDKLIALEPQSILPLTGASISDVTLRPVANPAICLAKGALGTCDGARAISILSN